LKSKKLPPLHQVKPGTRAALKFYPTRLISYGLATKT